MKPGEPTQKSRTWMTKAFRWSGLPVLTVAADIGGYLAERQLTGNFHTVIAGELYRSARLSPMTLRNMLKQTGYVPS